jgi:hypothetical protein
VATKPIGSITRGTTNPNRLRRIDRFIAELPVLRNVENPVVVDLGFGASAITPLELLDRLAKRNPRVIVVGVEIDRERVNTAAAHESPQLHFVHGGFETPLPKDLGANRPVEVIRALNVLRQYNEADVADAWTLMQSRLTDQGRIIEGTCDELGRYASWVTLDREKPLTFTISLRLQGLELPSKVQERLPKALIHHNVPGERVHNYLKALDDAWLKNAPLATFGAVQRWVATCQQIADSGWPVVKNIKRHKLGELTVDWAAVDPNAGLD